MFTAQRSGTAAWLATTDLTVIIALAAAALLAFLIIDVAARRLTAAARERARIRATAWAEHRARAARRRARVRARTRAVARSFMDTPGARRALLALLAFTGLAATILSAHGIQDALTDANLTSWWARACGFAAFEGFMLTMFALSWWHRTTSQEGFDIYGVLTWVGSVLLAAVGYHGGGDWIYLVFAPLAAAGFHLTAGAERRRRGGAPSWVSKAAAAAARRWDALTVRLGRTPTSADTNARDAERRRARVAHRFVKARAARGIMRGPRAAAFERAVAAAGARGLLDAAGRAVVAELVATRVGAFAALDAAAAADGIGSWAAPAPVPVRALEPERPARAPRVRAARVLPVEGPASAPDAPGDLEARMIAAFEGRTKAAAFTVAHYQRTGDLPTGKELAEACRVHEATGRAWLAPVKAVLEAA